MCENKNNPVISSLPRTKYKEKWLQRQPQTEISLQKKYYDTLQVDEFHTFVLKRKNKVWLIYAYHAKTDEIVAFVWDKCDL